MSCSHSGYSFSTNCADKYLLKEIVPQWTERMKDEILARVNAFPHSGLSAKMNGNVCHYFKSFVGRDFKRWAQMPVFILSPYLM